MLLTLLMNLNMFGEPPIPPDRLLINVGCPIETEYDFTSIVTVDEVITSRFETGIVTRSKISKTTTIDSPITKKI